MLGLIWGLKASRMAEEAASTAARGAARAGVVGDRLKALEDRLDKLLLVCMAMWSLLQERAELTEEELLEKVKEIDLRDGVPDGKITTKVAKCPKCKRVMSPRHGRCLYCGAHKLNVTAFDRAL